MARAWKPRVFVVDDDPSTLELLCEIARDAGWAVDGFVRLTEVRRTLRHVTPSLVILDDDLPDGLGGDFAHELRDDPGMAGIPVLVCTAAHPMRQAEIGAWAPVVSKPFDLAEIERFLAAAAGARRRGHSYDRAG